MIARLGRSDETVADMLANLSPIGIQKISLRVTVGKDDPLIYSPRTPGRAEKIQQLIALVSEACSTAEDVRRKSQNR